MKKSQSGFAILGFLLILIVFAAIAGAGYYLINQKNAQLKKAEEDKKATQSQLSAAQAKIDQLDSPIRKENDEKRKSQLAQLNTTILKFKTNTGQFPSTEPSFFKKEFVDVYITNKLADFTDPNTKQAYDITPVAAVQTPPGLTLGAIQYQWPAECAGSEFKDIKDQTKAATRLLLESGDTYCANI